MRPIVFCKEVWHALFVCIDHVHFSICYFSLILKKYFLVKFVISHIIVVILNIIFNNVHIIVLTHSGSAHRKF